jgi:hypothetical protein
MLVAVLFGPGAERGKLRGSPRVHLGRLGLLGGRRVRPGGRVADETL